MVDDFEGWINDSIKDSTMGKWSIVIRGFQSREMAEAMLKQLTAPHDYQVILALPTSFIEGDNDGKS